MLATCAYIDLNPVAAGVAEVPEASDHTGRLFREGKAVISAELGAILERLGSSAENWQARLRKLSSLCLGWPSPPRCRRTLGFGYFSGVLLNPVLGFSG